KAIGAELDITGDILKEKAIHFAQLLDINDFKALEGWLTKFKQRHNIKQYTKQGEAA
ncbi:10873_t:CDS:1, partial [Entrophospora sp. SA101]